MKPSLSLVLISIASLLILLLSPMLGFDAHVSAEIKHRIMTEIRIPRVLFAFIAGSGLALCGMVFQAMFHNPLATPFTLGVASGASLGAAIYVSLGLSFSFLGINGTSFAAFSGALLAISIVYSIIVAAIVR